MANVASLGAVREELELAQRIVAELRASLSNHDQDESLSKLEAALSGALANLNAAERADRGASWVAFDRGTGIAGRPFNKSLDVS